jgi:putative flippase GtrA
MARKQRQRVGLPNTSALARAYSRQIVVYCAVGSAGALGYVLLAALLSSVMLAPAWLASTVAYAVLIPPIYMGQHRLTFQSTANHSVAFARYVCVQGIGLVVSAALSQLMVAPFGRPPLLAFSITAVLVAMTNFLLLKLWTFRGR